MTKTSTSSSKQVKSECTQLKSPKSSTITYIRQFAHAYTVIAGVGMMLN